MRPEGRKAGGEKIKTPRSGVIIFFFSLFVKSFRIVKTVKIALTLTFRKLVTFGRLKPPEHHPVVKLAKSYEPTKCVVAQMALICCCA
jgi:hypothetical protein